MKCIQKEPLMPFNLKTAAAYIRVSTADQTELSPDSQLKVVRDYAKAHGFIIPNEYVFRDDGISGRRADKRPQFNSMIATAKQKPSPFCAVLLWKFSRFARNQEESIFYKSMLRKNGVEVISVSEPIIDGVFGSLIERIIEWSDEYYSIRLSGEVKRGMLEKVERGGAVSIPSFGYDIVDKQYVPNPETAPIVRQLFADYLNGAPTTALARKLNDLHIKTTRGNRWENRTVEYILRNPVYIGKIRWNPKRRTRRAYDDPDIIIVDGTHEPLIDKEVFDRAQELILINKQKYQPHARKEIKNPFMLHGLVRCSCCGATLVRSSLRNDGLQCHNYLRGKCPTSHYISMTLINEAVIAAIEQSFASGTFPLTVRPAVPAVIHDDVINPAVLIEHEQQKLRRVREAYEDGVYTLAEFKESKRLVNEQIDKLLALQDEQKKKTAPTAALRNQLIEKYKTVPTTLRNPEIDEEEKNSLIREFIDHITFNRTTTTINIIFYTTAL